MSAERTPNSNEWARVPTEHVGHLFRGVPVSAWQSGSICVVSSLEDVETDDGKEVRPHWHISISEEGRPPSHRAVLTALNAFGMGQATEHSMGVMTRQFWLLAEAQ